MNTNRLFTMLITAGMFATLSGCALLTKSAPIVPRYFDPETELLTEEASKAPSTFGDKRLRLGRVEAGPHLRERMTYRASETEVGYYNDRRWTERPAAYLRRALSYSLFEHYGVTRVVSGEAPNLDAELVAFEELKGSEHKVRVRIVVTLDDSKGGALDETVAVEVLVAEGSDDEDVAPVVHAFSKALSQAVQQVSQFVLEQLEQIPSVGGELPMSE